MRPVAPRAVVNGNGTHEIGPEGLIEIVDGDGAMRSVVAAALGRAGMRTVEASCGEEALEVARRERPALVLLDVCLSDTSGYEISRTLRREFGDELPIIFTSGDRITPLDRTVGLMLGADDYIVKPYFLDELVARARRFVATPARMHFHSTNDYYLTPRELGILRLLATGDRPADIAEHLHISSKTVSNHLQRIFSKLNVHSQSQAVTLAYRENLLQKDAGEGNTSPLFVESAH